MDRRMAIHLGPVPSTFSSFTLGHDRSSGGMRSTSTNAGGLVEPLTQEPLFVAVSRRFQAPVGDVRRPNHA